MMVHFLLLEDLGEDSHLRFAWFLYSLKNGVHIINSRLRPLNLDFGHHEVNIQEIFLFKLNGYCWLSLCNCESLTIELIRPVNKIEVVQRSDKDISFLRWVLNTFDHINQIVGLRVSNLSLNRILVILFTRNGGQFLDFARSKAIFTAEGQ